MAKHIFPRAVFPVPREYDFESGNGCSIEAFSKHPEYDNLIKTYGGSHLDSHDAGLARMPSRDFEGWGRIVSAIQGNLARAAFAQSDPNAVDSNALVARYREVAKMTWGWLAKTRRAYRNRMHAANSRHHYAQHREALQEQVDKLKEERQVLQERNRRLVQIKNFLQECLEIALMHGPERGKEIIRAKIAAVCVLEREEDSLRKTADTAVASPTRQSVDQDVDAVWAQTEHRENVKVKEEEEEESNDDGSDDEDYNDEVASSKNTATATKDSSKRKSRSSRNSISRRTNAKRQCVTNTQPRRSSNRFHESLPTLLEKEELEERKENKRYRVNPPPPPIRALYRQICENTPITVVPMPGPIFDASHLFTGTTEQASLPETSQHCAGNDTNDRIAEAENMLESIHIDQGKNFVSLALPPLYPSIDDECNASHQQQHQHQPQTLSALFDSDAEASEKTSSCGEPSSSDRDSFDSEGVFDVIVPSL